MSSFVVYERSGYAGGLAANEAAGGDVERLVMPSIVERPCNEPTVNEDGMTLLVMPAIVECPCKERPQAANESDLATFGDITPLVMPSITPKEGGDGRQGTD